MNNLVYLIGNLIEEPNIEIIKEEKSKLILNIKVRRQYPNEDGTYENDIFRCVTWNGVAKHTSERCHKGDLVGIKGRLQTRTCVDSDEIHNLAEVVADRVSLLASKRNEE